MSKLRRRGKSIETLFVGRGSIGKLHEAIGSGGNDPERLPVRRGQIGISLHLILRVCGAGTREIKYAISEISRKNL